MDFEEIIGHEKQILAIQRAIRNKNINHCYLLDGDEGLGKKKIALAFSKTLLCKEEGETPCNCCSSCTKFNSGNHPDFQIISPENGIIKKNQIESLISSMATSPFESRKKIFVIEDCHLMRSESHNALLKTLEEPPNYVHIILVTSSSNQLLPTILSRCQIIKFYPLEYSKVEELLKEKYGLEENKVKFIVGFTKGTVDKSIEIAQSEEFFKNRERIIDIISSLLRGDRTKAFSTIDFFNDNKENIEEILDIILYWFRDLLIFIELGESELIINRDKIHILSEQTFIDLNKINDIIYRVEETKINIRRNVNFNLSIETMLLNI